MMVASCPMAHATSAWRRSGVRTTPVGHWWAGVSSTARAPVAASDRDGDRFHAYPDGRGTGGAATSVARVLEGHPPHASLHEDPQREVQPLGEPGADHDAFGIGRGRPHA